MRKTPKQGTGFGLSVVLNLIFNSEWLIFGLFLLGLHFWLGLPIWFSYIAFGFWIALAFAITLVLSFGSSNRDSLKTPGRRLASERLRQKANEQGEENPYVTEFDKKTN